MSVLPSAAMLVADAAAGAALMPLLAQRRPDLAWQWRIALADAVFDLCGGGFALVVVDADHAPPGFEALLRNVFRAAPDTRLLVHARDPRHPCCAVVAACGWLTLVATDVLPDAVAALGSGP